MTNHRSIIPLALGFVTSVLAHLAVIVPMLVAIMTASGWQSVRLDAAFDPDDFKAPEQESVQDEEVRLGIDAPTPSSFTWIGYEEYQEHLAVLAEVEQAANSPAPPAQHADPLNAESPEPPEQDQSQPTIDARAAAAQLAKLLEILEFAASPTKSTNDQADTPNADRTDLQRALTSLNELLAKAMDKAREETEVVATNPPAPKLNPQAPPTSGNASEMESDPTSKLEVLLADIKVGKPIAGHGLQIKPRRPSFTTLTMLTAAPGNPFVEIRFPHSGRPVLAKILESSGDRRVDEAILNSLYRWRAQGEQLEALGEGESIPIRLRIVLVKPRGS